MTDNHNEPMTNEDLVDLVRKHYPETPHAPFEQRQERDLLHQLADRLERGDIQTSGPLRDVPVSELEGLMP